MSHEQGHSEGTEIMCVCAHHLRSMFLLIPAVYLTQEMCFCYNYSMFLIFPYTGLSFMQGVTFQNEDWSFSLHL